MRQSIRGTVRQGIARLRVRWWRIRLLRHTLQGLFYLLLGAALVLLLFPELALVEVGLAVAAGAVFTGWLLSFLARPSAVGLAKAYDDAAGLADRVSSAVQLGGEDGPMVEQLQREAEAATRSVPAREVYPFRAPREGRWLPVPAALVALVLLVPILTSPPAEANEAFEESLEERIEALEELLSVERERELSPRSEELLEELLKLRAELDGERVDKKDTQAEVARMLDKLRQEQRDEEARERELKELLKALQENTNRSSLDPSLQQGDYQKALNKLREELEELRRELEKKREEGASPEELEALEEELKKLEELEAKLMQLLQLDLDLRFMGKAIDFLAHWDGELGDLEDFDPDQIVEPGEP